MWLAALAEAIHEAPLAEDASALALEGLIRPREAGVQPGLATVAVEALPVVHEPFGGGDSLEIEDDATALPAAVVALPGRFDRRRVDVLRRPGLSVESLE